MAYQEPQDKSHQNGGVPAKSPLIPSVPATPPMDTAGNQQKSAETSRVVQGIADSTAHNKKTHGSPFGKIRSALGKAKDVIDVGKEGVNDGKEVKGIIRALHY